MMESSAAGLSVLGRRGWLVFVLAGLAGCVTPVRVDYEASANFNDIRTFAVADRSQHGSSETVALSEIVDRRIDRAIRRSLEGRGLRQQATNPDILVNYFVVTRMRTEVVERFPPPPPQRGRRGELYYPSLWYGGGFEIREFEEGTFVIDLVDTATNQLIWRGNYTRRVGWSAPTEDEVAKIVNAMLSRYPPR